MDFALSPGIELCPMYILRGEFNTLFVAYGNISNSLFQHASKSSESQPVIPAGHREQREKELIEQYFTGKKVRFVYIFLVV